MSTSWWLEALQITEKIIRENDFEHKKKKPRLSANWASNNWAQMVDDILHSFFSPKTSNLSRCLLLNSYCRSLSRVWLGFQVKMCHKDCSLMGTQFIVQYRSKVSCQLHLISCKARTKIFSKRYLKDWGKQALDFWLSFFQEAFF